MKLRRRPSFLSAIGIVFTVLFLTPALQLGAQSTPDGDGNPEELRYDASLSWPNAEIVVESVVTSRSGTGVPTTLAAERIAERSLARRMIRSSYAIQLNSLYTVADFLEANPSRTAELGQQVSEPDLIQRYPTADLRGVVLRHRLPLYPQVIEPFVSHVTPSEPPRHIGWIPTRRFTGIVIYAADPLPVHGTSRREFVEPALMPEVFDSSEDMRRIIGPEMMEPAMLRDWGVAAYTDDPDLSAWEDRIGLAPLRVRATGAFGIYPTDLIIAEEDANLILAEPENRRLIEEGRILIILNDQVTTTNLTRN